MTEALFLSLRLIITIRFLCLGTLVEGEGMRGGVGGVGTDSLKTDSRFDFLSFFHEKDEEDAVPDSFFINNQCSPYANTAINCNYIDTDEICKL